MSLENDELLAKGRVLKGEGRVTSEEGEQEGDEGAEDRHCGSMPGTAAVAQEWRNEGTLDGRPGSIRAWS